MMQRLLVFIFTLLSLHTFAQKKITTIQASDDIVFASVDRVGELYISTKNGQIQKFNIDGELSTIYRNGPTPTLFEPRDGSRLLAFFRQARKIDYLNPSFEVSHSYILDSAFVIEPWLACSAGDYNVWVLDAADLSFKKINPRTSTLEIEAAFPKNLASDFTSINLIREYQNFLFFLDRANGIHVFNSFGKWIKTIPVKGLSYFNFVGEELYYPADGKLIFFNLFSGEQREMPISKPFNMALLTDERLFLIQTKSIDFFEFKP